MHNPAFNLDDVSVWQMFCILIHTPSPNGSCVVSTFLRCTTVELTHTLQRGGIYPRSVDLSGIQLNVGIASVLSDVFTIEWGLRKLVFKECDLDEHVSRLAHIYLPSHQCFRQILKPMLHALLIPGTLTFLSVASNRRMKAPAFRLIGAYVSKARPSRSRHTFVLTLRRPKSCNSWTCHRIFWKRSLSST